LEAEILETKIEEFFLYNCGFTELECINNSALLIRNFKV